VGQNPQHASMIHQLEAAYDTSLEELADQQGLSGPLPSGDELAEELQRFLREQDD
jgi:hypothetical protein